MSTRLTRLSLKKDVIKCTRWTCQLTEIKVNTPLGPEWQLELTTRDGDVPGSPPKKQLHQQASELALARLARHSPHVPFSLITNCRPFLSCSTWIWESLASKALACAACAIAAPPRNSSRRSPCYSGARLARNGFMKRCASKAKHFVQQNQLWGHVTASQSPGWLSGSGLGAGVFGKKSQKKPNKPNIHIPCAAFHTSSKRCPKVFFISNR